jgi:hypothetical protein
LPLLISPTLANLALDEERLLKETFNRKTCRWKA